MPRKPSPPKHNVAVRLSPEDYEWLRNLAESRSGDGVNGNHGIATEIVRLIAADRRKDAKKNKSSLTSK